MNSLFILSLISLLVFIPRPFITLIGNKNIYNYYSENMILFILRIILDISFIVIPLVGLILSIKKFILWKDIVDQVPFSENWNDPEKPTEKEYIKFIPYIISFSILLIIHLFLTTWNITNITSKWNMNNIKN
jgi:hypothetical protein